MSLFGAAHIIQGKDSMKVTIDLDAENPTVVHALLALIPLKDTKRWWNRFRSGAVHMDEAVRQLRTDVL